MLHVRSLLFGCLLCLVVTSVLADGRVFVLGPTSLSGVLAFRDALQACASQRARLASVEELRHAVAECFFSQCARGWLHGGTVGTTVCDVEGSSLKAVNVRTENGTKDTAHLSAFCIKDKAVACGDPPSFPNARLQESSGFEMGDELLYTCLPGYVMPTGHAAFSLMCDSCGEWYGTVQLCVKDKTESHVDYEDKFEDSYEAADHDRGSPEEQHDKTSEEVFGSQDRKTSLQQQTTRIRVNAGAEQQDQHEERDVREAVINNRRAFGGAVDEAATREDLVHPSPEQERSEDVGTNAAEATEEPVSLLSQKHLFWFPSEAFQNEKAPLSPDSITQTKQRASGAQSQESKEKESQERHDISQPTDDDDHDDDHDDEQDRYDEPDNDEEGDHDDSHHDDHDHDNPDDHDDNHDDHEHDQDGNDHDDHDHDDHDDHEDDLTDNPDDPDSHQEEDDDHVTHRGEHENTRDRHQDHDDHDDHYGTGTHEKDRDHVGYGTQEYDDQDDPYDEHHSREDHDDTTEDHDDNDDEHPDGSEEHPDHNDHDDDDHLPDHDIHDDHEDKYEKSYDDHDSHEDDDGHSRVIFSVATEERPTITQRGAGSKIKDETWLDGYPIQGTENGDSTKRPIRPVDGEQAVKTTDRPNDVEARKRIPHTNSPNKRTSPTTAPERVVEKVRPGYRTPGTSSDHLQPSDSPSYSDTLDYDTQQAAPTQSWLDELTEHPFLDHGLAPPVHDGDIFPGLIGEHAVHNLPGEMGEAEGEMGEAICTGDDCPPLPPSSSSRGPTVAAIAVLVCLVAMAVIFGVWCYKRQQQKSSIYEMNGKGQSQSRQGQQMEMQQKV
ncbi:sushi domain-containing protein 5 [Austrofundulus limnaeus]|uniref:Sushi domain-containing protein 5 n=1 Tax=Austrofundulus limnaeus TaxID=52670 RepID=A0A2I4B0D1_AUSLI|nr:PREDICTED: sushi domain-containing protein 5 [Austrofundulus limnaeus]